MHHSPPFPLIASLTTPLLASAPQDEDTINTVAEQTRLKDIPVPISIAQVRVDGTNSFVLPTEQMRSPAPTEQWPVSWKRCCAIGSVALREVRVTWARIGAALQITRQSAWERFSGEE